MHKVSWLGKSLHMKMKKDFSWVKSEKRWSVETHWRFSHLHAHNYDYDELFRRLVPIRLADREIYSIPPEDHFVMLCIHGSIHGWERLEWLLLASELTQRASEFSWQKVLDLADKLACRRALSIWLTLARELLNAPVPSSLIDDSSDGSKVQPVARLMASRMIEDDIRNSPLERMLNKLAIMDSRLERVRGLVATMVMAVLDPVVYPRGSSWASIISLALRPIRLILKHRVGFRWLQRALHILR